MNQGTALRQTATLVERLEAAGLVVEDVSVADDNGDGTPLELRLRLPDAPLELSALERGESSVERTPESANETGTGRFETPSTATTNGTDHNRQQAVAQEGEDADSSKSSGGVPCPIDNCEETFGSDQGMKIHVAKSHGDDENAPVHRDPEQLKTVYERHDTFAEMRDALGVDVTTQTVRRNMMNFGIHDPDAGSDDETETSDRAEVETKTDAERDQSGTNEDAPDPEPSGQERSAATDGGGGVVAPSAESHQPPSSESATIEPASTGPADIEPESAKPADIEPESTGPADIEPESTGTADIEPAGTEIASTEPGVSSEEPEREQHESPLADITAADLNLPEHVTLEAFVDAVANARTLFDVQRTLDLERSQAQTLLAELDLLEFVHGRVADQERCCETPTAEIERRIQDRIDGQ